jgi:prepilin-type N-terminal cleavage/methylation domain-containing protein
MPAEVPARPCAPRRAFTMVEMLVTITIIVILMGLSVGIIRVARERSAVTATQGTLKQLNIALEKHKEDTGDYPDCNIDIGNCDTSRPAWYNHDTSDGTQPNSPPPYNRIANRYEFQQTSYALYNPLDSGGYEENISGEYVDPDPAVVDVEWDLDENGSYASNEQFKFGYLDYWGEPLIYLYDPAQAPELYDSSNSTFLADWPEAFENTYQLWSAGPDGKFDNFRPSNEDDADADNVPGKKIIY